MSNAKPLLLDLFCGAGGCSAGLDAALEAADTRDEGSV